MPSCTTSIGWSFSVVMPSIRNPSRKFGGFVAVGLLNFAITLLLYEVLILFVSYWLAYTTSFVAGIAFSLVANAGMVFGRRVTAASASSYAMFYLISYAAGLNIVILLASVVHAPPDLAPLGAIAVLVLINHRDALRAWKRANPANKTIFLDQIMH